jgi:hypothetical protein
MDYVVDGGSLPAPLADGGGGNTGGQGVYWNLVYRLYMSRPIPLLLALFDDGVDLSLYWLHVLRCSRERRASNLPSADNRDVESESATGVFE